MKFFVQHINAKECNLVTRKEMFQTVRKVKEIFGHRCQRKFDRGKRAFA